MQEPREKFQPSVRISELEISFPENRRDKDFSNPMKILDFEETKPFGDGMETLTFRGSVPAKRTRLNLSTGTQMKIQKIVG